MFRGTPTSPARSSRRWDCESCASAFCANPKSVLSQGHEGRHVAAGSQRGAVPISELDLAQKTPKKAQLAVSVGSAVREVDLGQEARVQLFFLVSSRNAAPSRVQERENSGSFGVADRLFF